MQTKSRTKTVRIDVSESVHTRLLKFGASFPQRINTLLACKEVVVNPVNRPLGARKGIHMTHSAHKTLLIAQEALGCASISNTIESMLNTNPNIPLHVKISDELANAPVNASLRVKQADHDKLKAIADKEGIPLWMAVHQLILDHETSLSEANK